jgi:hypothetical protein
VTNWEGQIALYLEGHGMRDEDIETVIEACRIDPGRRDELLRLASSPWGAGWWRILGQRGFNEPEIH